MQTSKLNSDLVPIQTIVGSSALASLLVKARQLQAMQRTLQPLLPLELQPHCQVANTRDQTLILAVDSAAWGMRLQFLYPQLLAQLPPTWHITKITYYIKPGLYP